VNLGLGVHVLRSSDTNVMGNREDPDVSLGWQRDTDKGRFGLKAQYVESSTLSGSVLDTGVVTTDGTQKMTLLTGNWTHALTERTTLDNQTTYSHARYDITTLTGYDEMPTPLPWTRLERSHRRVHRPAGAPLRARADRHGAGHQQLYPDGWRQVPTDRPACRYRARWRQPGFRLRGRASWRGRVLLDYSGERADASFSAERSTVASAEGGFAELDMVRGLWSYAVARPTAWA
jgi:hypothetical protein